MDMLNTENGEFKHYMMNNVKKQFMESKLKIEIIKK